jgi:NADP-dependent 3-hydroxy acid dehydrogenase YdfG
MKSDIQVVTGCSSGIGRATAFALAKSGHRVIAAGRDIAAMRQLSEEAGAMRLPGRIAGVPDVDRPG